MACTCVKETQTLDNVFVVILKEICQECADAQVAAEAYETKQREIRDKKAYLASTDYIVLRQTEQSTLSAEDYAVVVAARQAARDRINQLEA